MAAAQECPDDPGAYFIVKGAEKSLLMAEQMAMNRIILSKNSKGFTEATVASSTTERKSRCSIVLEGRCFYLKHNTFAKRNIPVVVVFKAMGFINDITILSLVGTDQLFLDYMSLSIQECIGLGIYTQRDALEYLSKNFGTRSYASTKPPLEEARDCLAHFVLSHIPVIEKLSDGSEESKEEKPTKLPLIQNALPTNAVRFNWLPKAVYLATMIRRAILFDFGIIKGDGKDFVGNKKIETANDLLELVFDDAFKDLVSSIAKKMDIRKRAGAQTASSVSLEFNKLISPDIITKKFVSAISTGHWNIERFHVSRIGVTQVLSRLSYLSALGQVTRLASAFDKEVKSSGPRMLNFSQLGIFCPSDTPEGESVGLVKNLCVMARISTEEDSSAIHQLLLSVGVERLPSCWTGDGLIVNSYIVFLNGSLIGSISKASIGGFFQTLRHLRRHGYLSYMTNFFLNAEHSAVYVNCDAGRACRPLLVVENGKVLLTLRDIELLVLKQKTFVDFVHEGKIEYLDVNEALNAYVAMTPRDITPEHTHCELESYTLLGYVVGLIPYPHHNQSPRNCYQCSMGKQASGAIAYNQFERFEAAMFLLDYPQRPLTSTKILKLTGYENLPAGQNATVCVMSYSGFDIEDAIVLNKAAIDRGFGRCSIYRSVSEEININKTPPDQFNGPPLDLWIETIEDGEVKRRINPKHQAYHALDSDGTCAVAAHMQPGDILINKCLVTREERVPSSIPIKSPTETTTYIDKVLLTTTMENNLLVKVLTREPRRPEVGDKFSSRHGQKGVCGLIVPQTDLPFTSQGIVPDLIMNPHGYPSRMTIAKLLELISNKSGCFRGEQTDATCFRTKDEPSFITDLYNSLLQLGFSCSGKDVLYSGSTGDVMPVYIFNGPIFYQKLKHMVKDKIHSRSTGPRMMLTRQPTEGRRAHGGLRMGEMERDCAVSYGASSLLIERFMLASDELLAYTCATCGLFCYEVAGSPWCQMCQTGDAVVKIRIPYATKLMINELFAMGVMLRFELGDCI